MLQCTSGTGDKLMCNLTFTVCIKFYLTISGQDYESVKHETTRGKFKRVLLKFYISFCLIVKYKLVLKFNAPKWNMTLFPRAHFSKFPISNNLLLVGLMMSIVIKVIKYI